MNNVLVDAMNLPEHEFKILMADSAVLQWMDNPDNVRYLRERQAEYLHTKGWAMTKEKLTKAEACIPPDAYFHLPQEWRIDPKRKELMKWVRTSHPYLLLKH